MVKIGNSRGRATQLWLDRSGAGGAGAAGALHHCSRATTLGCAVQLVGRRHDLDLELVEDVEDLAVEVGVEKRDPRRVVDVGVQLVGDREVSQRLLQHEVLPAGGEPRGALGGEEQHRLDLPPGGLVADSDTVVCRISPSLFAIVL